MRTLRLALAITALTAVLAAKAGTADSSVVTMTPIQAERLPDLHVPRAGHCVFWVDGELMVAGGHTTGFVPTPTAEFLRDGAWQVQPTVYCHDQAFTLQLSTGEVLLAGGHAQDLGIGQLFSLERYDPKSRQFIGFGCLDTKRVFAQGTELDSGRVVISGNWYHDDAIELYNGEPQCQHVSSVAVERARPFVFRIAPDDAIILGAMGPRGEHIDNPIVVDRLRGDTLHIPLFATWHPFFIQCEFQTAQSFIGDESKGRYAYLMPVENDEGQMAIARVEGTDVALLPTTQAVPITGISGERISYFSTMLADRQRGRAYLVGTDQDAHYYVVAVDYADGSERPSLTCYYTDTLQNAGCAIPLLTPDGDIIIAGGARNSNYSPKSGVWLLPMSQPDGKATAADAAVSVWPWLLLFLAAGAAVAAVWAWRRRCSHAATGNMAEADNDDDNNNDSTLLMQRLCKVMEQQQPFLNSELKVSDVSRLLGVSQRTLSQCITKERQCTFSYFVNGYRVEHAKKMIRECPDKKFTTVGTESGFANETSFYRTFKSFTGKTPGGWVKDQND